jgi:hypothetical protein
VLLAVLAPHRVPQIQPRPPPPLRSGTSQPLAPHAASTKSRHYIVFSRALTKNPRFSLPSLTGKFFLDLELRKLG